MDRNITPQVWAKIRQEYISSSVSQRDLVKKYGVPKCTLAKKAKREDWVGQREQLTDKVVQKTTDDLVDGCVSLYELALETSEKILRQINRQMDNIAESADGVAGSELKAYTGAIKDLREMGFFRATLDKQEQEARIRKLQKECEEEQKDNHITITFEGGDAYGD